MEAPDQRCIGNTQHTDELRLPMRYSAGALFRN